MLIREGAARLFGIAAAGLLAATVGGCRLLSVASDGWPVAAAGAAWLGGPAALALLVASVWWSERRAGKPAAMGDTTSYRLNEPARE